MIEDYKRLVERARARAERARQHVYALCRGEEKWTMRTPVQKERDSDYLIVDALDGVDTLADALEKQSDAVERLSGEIQQIVSALPDMPNGRSAVQYAKDVAKNSDCYLQALEFEQTRAEQAERELARWQAYVGDLHAAWVDGLLEEFKVEMDRGAPDSEIDICEGYKLLIEKAERERDEALSELGSLDFPLGLMHAGLPKKERTEGVRYKRIRHLRKEREHLHENIKVYQESIKRLEQERDRARELHADAISIASDTAKERDEALAKLERAKDIANEADTVVD